MKILEVVAGIVEYNGKILCTQRGDGKNKDAAFKWEFPGGKVESGESFEDALKRELVEELNLEIEIKGHFCDVEYDYKDFVLNMHCFKCEVKSDKLELNVHKDYKWLDKNELMSVEWVPADIDVVYKIISSNK